MAKVYVTVVINASVDKVWETIRDFNSLPKWHPFIETSHIEADLPNTTVGCVRNFQLKDGGGTIREQLVALSDVDRSCSYTILDAPLAVENYLATLRLIEMTDHGTTLGEWQAEFEAPPDQQSETVDLVGSIFREGLRNLDKLLSSQ